MLLVAGMEGSYIYLFSCASGIYGVAKNSSIYTMVPSPSNTKKPLELLFRAMYHDKFDFSEFVNFDIEENYTVFNRVEHGQSRKIIKPNKKLKIFHKFLNLFVFEYLPIQSDVVFSYRKGFSTHDAVVPHAKSINFFQSDISNFFGCISRELIHQVINKNLELIPVIDLDAHIDKILRMVCIDNSLPPGLPASPTISNSILLAFDEKINDYCRLNSFIYTRYSDDIIISGDGVNQISHLKEIVSTTLSETYNNNFKINETKSKVFRKGGKVSILGLTILPNGHVTIDAKIRRESEILLYFYLTDRDKFAQISSGSFEKNCERISGFINYANATDRIYLDKLRRKYGAATVDLFLHRNFH